MRRPRGVGLRILLFASAAAAVMALLVLTLWNALMPAIFGLPAIGFWQALGLFALSRLLFGRWGGWGWGGVAAGLAAGALIGGAVAGSSYGYGYGSPYYGYGYGYPASGYGYGYAPANSYASYGYPTYSYGYGTGYTTPVYGGYRYATYHPVLHHRIYATAAGVMRHWR